jgi:Ca-activated chloride channel family protein
MNLFAKPQILWLLLILVVPLCAFLFWSWRTKQKLIAKFVQSRLLSNLTVGVSQTRQKLRLVLFASAVLFLVLAMARPQWGFSWEETRQQGLDIVVAIDTSRSMLAEDITPNRLSRAKLAALDLMRLAKSDRLGLVAFAGSAFLQCPLTLDEEAFRESVEALDVGIIPQGGTALTEAIQSALGAFEKGSENHKVLVLFTDGEDHDSGALASAEKAAKEGLQIFTIGVGTAEGELIRVQDEQGNSGFLKDEAGNAVKSRLDETLLQKIATAAKGFYLPLRGAKAMETLYAKGLAPLPKSDSTTKLVRQYRERFQWPLGIAIALLVLEMFLPQRKRVAAVAVKDTNRAASAGLAVLLFLLGSFAVKASPSGALREYEAGDFHSALDEFRQLSQEKTNDLRLSYNAGAAAYRAKQFDDAEKFFGQATAAPDLALQQKAYYNLGNTLFQAGARVPEPDKKQESWESSAKSFENALKLNPQDKDAKNNLEVVKKKLEELKKQQQQQQKQQSKNDQNKNQKDNPDQQKNQNKSQQEQKKDSQSEQKEGEKKDDSQQSNQDSEQKESDQKKNSEQEQQKQAQRQKQGERQEKPGEKEAGQQQAAAMVNGKMTPEQARQFLDAQKQEDKALIFAPPKNPAANRHVKDW